MSAHMIDLPQDRCATCGKAAKVEVKNGSNGRVGTFCRPCGRRRVQSLLRDEQALAAARANQEDELRDHLRKRF